MQIFVLILLFALNSKLFCDSLIVSTAKQSTMSNAAEKSKVQSPQVVLLHGLARSASSMEKMEKALMANGYAVCSIDYPSRKHSIHELLKAYIIPSMEKCSIDTSRKVNFVTHSMGGIMVRYLASQKSSYKFGRVVMLAPPNHGSEVVDKLGNMWAYKALNGPAGAELGTDTLSMPIKLGPVAFECGVIAGNRSINLILSMLIPGDDDGKVSIENAKIEGMKEFLVVPATHPLIMKNDEVIKCTIHFLKYGVFGVK